MRTDLKISFHKGGRITRVWTRRGTTSQHQCLDAEDERAGQQDASVPSVEEAPHRYQQIAPNGGNQAMIYGQAVSVSGVANSMLRDQRSIAAAIAAPASGRGGGEKLDAAFILADGGPKGYADPTFDARLLPIGEWAAAVWKDWLPRMALEKVFDLELTSLTRRRTCGRYVMGLVPHSWRPAAALDGKFLMVSRSSPTKGSCCNSALTRLRPSPTK